MHIRFSTSTFYLTGCKINIQFLLYFLITVVLCCVAHPSNSQEITWNEGYEIEDNLKYPKILGKGDNGYYVARVNHANKQTMILERYDQSLTRVNHHKIKFSSNQKLRKIFQINDRVFVFLTKRGSDNEKLAVYAFNSKLNRFDKKDLLHLTNNTKKPSNVIVKIEQGMFNVAWLPDNNQTPNITLHSAKIDSTLNILKESKIKTGLTFDGNIKNFTLRNNHLGAIIKNEANKNKAQHPAQLIYHNFNNQDSEVIELGKDSLYTLSGKLDYDRVNQQMIYTAYYYKPEEPQAKGIAYFKKPLAKKGFQSHFIPFPTEVIKQVYGARAERKGLQSFDLQEQIVRSDGGVILMAEEFEKEEATSNSISFYGVSRSSMRTYFYYRDLVIFSLGPKGNFNWYKVHRKNQNTVNDRGYFSSFASIVLKSKVILLYNEVARKDWRLMYYSLLPDGTLKGDVLLETLKANSKPIPKKTAHVSRNEILVPAYHPKAKFYLLKVKFGE